MPPATARKDLRPRTYAFARRIVRLYSALPKQTVAQVLGKQVLRSGTSVGANYREACRARSKSEFISKMSECLRELDETEYWLELMIDEAIVPEDKMTPLLDETRQLVAIFITIINQTRRNAGLS